MITPEQMESIVQPLLELYDDIELGLLRNVAGRLSIGDKIGGTAQWQIDKLMQLGELNQQNIKTLAKYSKLTERQVEEVIKKAGYAALSVDETLYQLALKDGAIPAAPIPLAGSAAIRQILDSAIGNTKIILNMVNTTALQSSQKAFIQAINKAYLETSTGVYSYDTAIRNAVKQLADSGINGVDYVSASGRHTRNQVDVAVRRAVLTSTSQVTGKLQLQRAEEWGCNLVEVTSHVGARPSHAVWQGRVYSIKGGTAKYPNLVEVTGYGSVAGLKGANCSHDFYPFFEGLSERVYKPYDAEENARIYEESQEQRKIERDIRAQKKRAAAMDAAGDTEGASAARSKLKEKQAEMRSFIDRTGRTRRSNRERV